jgi:O-antigen/teichoic acid export membrane protein
LAYVLAVALPILGGAWLAALLVMPASLGRLLMGGNWDSARHILPLLGAASCVAGIVFAANSALRALANGRRTLRARLLSFVVKSVSGVAGGAVAGASGAAAGMLISDSASAWIWWRQLSHALEETS